MTKHILICLYTALRLMVFCVGCSGDLTTIRATRAESRPPVDNAAIDTAAVTLRQEQFDSYMSDGQMLYRQGKYAESTAALRTAVALDPDNWQPYYFLGLVKTQTGEFAVAEAFLQESLDLAPTDNRIRCQVYLALGENCESQARYGRAQQHYQTALNIHPDSDAARQGIERIKQHHNLSGR